MDLTTRKQTTISEEVTVSGFGFWSGRDIQVTFRPAKAGSGIVFVRTDVPGQPSIPAIVQNRINGPRRTTLVNNGVAVEMVEHVLAALAGLRIDNCEILVDRAEMPGFDGSSQAFIEALVNVDIVELNMPRPKIFVQEALRVGDEFSWIEAKPALHGQLELIYELSYPCPAIGAQRFDCMVNPLTFQSEIAPARTFVLRHEAEQLRQQGLGERVTYQDVLVFDDHGPIENTLRFDDECARHKVLDMVGDFSLAGADLVGKFTASRSGHRLNSQMVFALLQQVVQSETKPIRIPA
ncbi:MAG: UDP-3-O-acyl-N-acetylglucosamine deacetylase [Planctomycetota bacterium]